MARPKNAITGPPLADILKAIERERGTYTDKASQERFLGGLQMSENSRDLDENEIVKNGADIRTRLQRQMREHGKNLAVQNRRAHKHGINHLFQMGPRQTLEQDFLDQLGADLGGESDDEEIQADDEEDEDNNEEDERPLAEILRAQTATSKTSMKQIPTSSNAPIDLESQKSARTADEGVAAPPSLAQVPPSLATDASAPRPLSKFRLLGPKPLPGQKSSQSRPDEQRNSPVESIYSEDELNRDETIRTVGSEAAQSGAERGQKRKADDEVVLVESQEDRNKRQKTHADSDAVSPIGRGQKRKLREQATETDLSREESPSKRQKRGESQLYRAPDAHTGPDPPSADKDQVHSWLADAELLGGKPTPKILPEKQPCRPDELFPYGDKSWTLRCMERVKDRLLQAVMVHFSQHDIDRDALSDFVINPSPELRELYEALVGGSGRWEAWAADQKMKGEECLAQECTVVGLMGAAIFKTVFQTTLPWDLRVNMAKKLGDDMEFWEGLIDDWGHDREKAIRYMAAKQFGSEKFQETKVAGHARQLAGTLIQTLQPHFEKLSKRSEPAEDDPPAGEWYDLLEEAFKEAIGVKHILSVSKLGPFEYLWPDAGTPLDAAQHNPFFEMTGAKQVLHPVLPAVWRKERDLYYSKAVVMTDTVK